jgi:hypothetical protein
MSVERNFDAEFYEYFATLAAERLRGLATAFAAASPADAPAGALSHVVEEARHALHNITGEARLLDLPDYAALVRRLSQPLGRIGTPLPELSPRQIETLARLCADLASLAQELPDVTPSAPLWQQIKGALDLMKP